VRRELGRPLRNECERDAVLTSFLREPRDRTRGCRETDALVFGKESVGLPDELLVEYKDRVVGIPTIGAVRSLNLANAAGIAMWEALRQCGAFEKTFTG